MGRSGQQALNLGLEGLHGGALRRKVKRRKGEGEGGEGRGRTSWAVVGEQHGAESKIRSWSWFIRRSRYDTSGGYARDKMEKRRMDGWTTNLGRFGVGGHITRRDGMEQSRAEQAGTGERGRASLTTVPMNTGIGSF